MFLHFRATCASKCLWVVQLAPTSPSWRHFGCQLVHLGRQIGHLGRCPCACPKTSGRQNRSKSFADSPKTQALANPNSTKLSQKAPKLIQNSLQSQQGIIACQQRGNKTNPKLGQSQTNDRETKRFVDGYRRENTSFENFIIFR